MVIVGCGRIVEFAHAPALSTSGDFRVIGLVDPSRDRRDTIAKLVDPHGETSRLSEPAPDLVAGAVVLLAAPTPLHRELLDRIVPYARAVIVEKPLAADAAGAAAVLAEARSAGIHLVPVHNWLHDPAMGALIRLTSSGGLGDLRSVKYVHHMTAPFPGVWNQQPLWRTWLTGGCVVDLGYHAVYISEEITGDVAIEANCTAERSSGVLCRAQVTLRLAHGLTCATSVSWSSDVASYEVRVVGSHGIAEVGDDGQLVLRREGQSRRVSHGAGFPLAYQRFYRDLADRLGRAPDYGVAMTAVRISQLLDGAVANAVQASEVSA